MKYSASIAIFLAVASMTSLVIGQHEHTCDECREGIDPPIKALGEYLQTESVIAITQEALAQVVCPTLPEDNVQGCMDFIYANWADLITAIFAYPDTTMDLCIGFGYCEPTRKVKIFKPKIECEDCAGDMGTMGTLLNDETFATKVKDNVVGPAYCDSTYNVGDVTECKKWIEIIGVQTVQAMGSIVMASAENICHDLGCTPEIF